VVQYACAMTLDVKVSDDVFCAAPHFDTTEIVELTSAIATYNMVARFLSGTRREPRPDTLLPLKGTKLSAGSTSSTGRPRRQPLGRQRTMRNRRVGGFLVRLDVVVFDDLGPRCPFVCR
jgi:hypothetical protein